jgi:peptidoglycan/xylan/chitin deacetylase (PgdA/CDA1 family)
MGLSSKLAAEGSALGWPLVLYFHHVSPIIQHYTALSPSNFRRGLELCLRNYGSALAPKAIETSLDKRLAEPRFLVTFDDGYLDVLEYALPIMQDLGIRAVHFLIADAVVTGSCAGITKPRAPFLNRADLGELKAAGHRLAAHSRSHRRFDTLTPEEIVCETAADNFDFAGRDSGSVELFAYPYGVVPAHINALPDDTLFFGTATSPMRDWDVAPHAIRRTFLPSDDTASWSRLISGWRDKWYHACP